MSEKFEKLLDLLVNEEKNKAEDLFHEIVVDKSREIYEELVSNDANESIEDSKAVEEPGGLLSTHSRFWTTRKRLAQGAAHLLLTVLPKKMAASRRF